MRWVMVWDFAERITISLPSSKASSISCVKNNRSMYHKLDIVSHKSLRDRILHYLSLQARKSNALAFDIPFSGSDLADYLNVDRSALSRELQRMAEDGLIRFTKNHFELLDTDGGLAILDF